MLDLLLLLVSGLGMWASFPPVGLWPLMIPALAVVVFTLDRVAPLRAGTYAWLWSCGFVVPLTMWVRSGGDVDLPTWIALVAVQGLFFAAWAAGLSAIGTWKWARSVWGQALGAALLWVAFEQLRARIPFGGFPWIKAAYPQAASPMVVFAPGGGELLVSLLVVIVAVLLRRAFALREPAAPSHWARLAALLIAVMVAYGPFFIRLPVAQQDGAIAVSTIGDGTKEVALDDGRTLPTGTVTAEQIGFEPLVALAVQESPLLRVIDGQDGVDVDQEQVVQIAQFRAAEFSRSTVVSGKDNKLTVIRPDGSLLGTSQNAELPLRSTRTLASRVGELPDWIVIYGGVGLTVSSLGAHQYGKVLVKTQQSAERRGSAKRDKTR